MIEKRIIIERLLCEILELSILQEKEKAKSPDLLIDMLKGKTLLHVWQSESNVLTNLVHTVRQKTSAGTGR